jgi:cation:H+ antiporter
LSIGVNSIINKTPDIFVGNLSGASIVLFLFIIPLLAILGDGIILSRQLPKNKLILSILAIISPFLLILDGFLSYFDAFALVAAYFLLISSIKHKRRLFRKIITKKIKNVSFNPIAELIKVLIGAVLIYIFSKVLVDQTVFFARLFHAPVLIISFLLLSLGTNLPELVIAINAVISHQKEVAFGNYVGSAAVNTLLFGILTFANGEFTVTGNGFLVNLIVFSFGLLLFYRFSTTKNDICRKEGWILLSLYLFLALIKIVEI